MTFCVFAVVVGLRVAGTVVVVLRVAVVVLRVLDLRVVVKDAKMEENQRMIIKNTGSFRHVATICVYSQ